MLVADATVSRVTDAFVGHHAKLRLGSNTLTLNATTPVTTANATADGGQGGLFTVAAFKSLANVGDDAVYLPGPTGIRGQVDVTGGAPWKIVKTGYDWVAAGYQIGDQITIIDPAVSADNPIGTFTITGFATTGPNGSNDTLLLSGAAPSTGNNKDWTINPVRKTRATRAVTAAFLDHDSDTEAGNVDLNATANSVGNADIQYLGISAFFGLNLSSVEAIVGHDVDTYVGDDARVNISGDLTLTSTNTATASPNISDTSVSGGIDISALTARGRITSDTTSWIGNGADVDARSVDLEATATHNATVTINTGGFGLLLNIDVLEARAEDVGSSSVRIGPDGGGSSGNPTQVTATGAGRYQCRCDVELHTALLAAVQGVLAVHRRRSGQVDRAPGRHSSRHRRGLHAVGRPNRQHPREVGVHRQDGGTRHGCRRRARRRLDHGRPRRSRPHRVDDGPGECVAHRWQRRKPREEDRARRPTQP